MADEDKDGSSALEREAKRVEDMTQSKEPGRDDDPELVKTEGVVRVEQDTRVDTMREQAKAAGAGSKQSPDDLNKDG